MSKLVRRPIRDLETLNLRPCQEKPLSTEKYLQKQNFAVEGLNMPDENSPEVSNSDEKTPKRPRDDNNEMAPNPPKILRACNWVFPMRGVPQNEPN